MLPETRIRTSVQCNIKRKMSRFSQCKLIPILLSSNPKILDDCVIFVGAIFPSVSTLMIVLYWEQEFVLATLPTVEYINPQETVSSHVMYRKEHWDFLKSLHIRSLEEYYTVVNYELLEIFFYHRFWLNPISICVCYHL